MVAPDVWWGYLLYTAFIIGVLMFLSGIGTAVIGLIIWPLLALAAVLLLVGLGLLLSSATATRLLCKANNIPFRWKCQPCGEVFEA